MQKTGAEPLQIGEYVDAHPITTREGQWKVPTRYSTPAEREDDITMQLRAFGTLPPVRTLRLEGSRCEVLKWSNTPRK